MKRFLKVLSVFAILLVVAVLAIFGMRVYNHATYQWEEDEVVHLHDYEAYPDTFSDGQITHFEEGVANGFHLQPDEPIDAPPVVLFGGSEGSSNFEEAVRLAKEGYETYALFFFGASNQPETLNRVPLEFFSDFLKTFDLEETAVTVIGYSKGAELALNLTNYYPTIEQLVLYTPSEYTYMGLEFSADTGSSWTWEGEELPYINFDGVDGFTMFTTMFDMLIASPIAYRDTYESAVENANNRETARINTSNFDGRALLFAGEKDEMWQGDTAARQIGEALGNQAEVVLYREAGHSFGMSPYYAGMALGGTTQANVEAKRDSDELLFDFLAE
ncbi:palmitoyl-CoA hydrolase [Geomicrobium sp. JCM 19037]|uniref:alpha/beta fold hydrolase n=1 Tax=Geomicrobium sp. JCM 19037 TaxID=1460634 RepID=UPI00045F2A1A|nr:acyl-CoA thioester hydrolase/BAAT C-terminal domain-containing protein [Geomicrobium sp. JCM 19037]GAK05954.1 palmitoyl-CoA hydrolase [Geomicrobium sp. JCM 19037]